MNLASNLDPQEIEKFNRLAQLWWDPNGKMGMLHTINPLRTHFIATQVNVSGKRILDVGCGGGILTESLARLGGQLTGMDLAPMPLEIAKQHAQSQQLDIIYRLEKIENLAKLEAQQYDIVVCLEMLEHVPRPESVIQSCAAVLKPNGHAFFSTINRNFKAWLFAIIGAEYILRLLPKGTHQYKKLIRPCELEGYASSSDLVLQKAASFQYNLFNKQFILQNKIDVNYIMHFIKS